ncbi:Zinc finger RING-type [Trinorchestia longiramus]|nr:Zinc finger RING-type [Trinorchestia longiramus]
MGGFQSRQNAGVQILDLGGANSAYRYPPRMGNYFSSHFIMGGERFDTAIPEMYLFGENMDLNFLGSRPSPFPYPAPSSSEPSKTLKALINIRKESVKLVKVHEETHSLKSSETVEALKTAPSDTAAVPPVPQQPRDHTAFNIEFTFDCDVRCAITIMYFCKEESTSQGLQYIPRDASMNSETYHYKKGANQQFSQSTHMFYPGSHEETDLIHYFERDMFPVVIYCVAEEGEEPRQSQATIGVVEKQSDGYILKALKQKLFVHGLCYLLQEIYGIENKNSDFQKNIDEETEDNGAECVICMSDLRDTLILPCRHLCLCNCCADSLRYQANNCPICRAPFRALLQIKALQKTGCGGQLSIQEGGDVPAGYEAVSLIEALNGPSVAPPVQPSAPSNNDLYVRLPQYPVTGTPTAKAPHSDRTTTSLEDSTTQTDNNNELQHVRMSVLLASEEAEDYVASPDLRNNTTDSPSPSIVTSPDSETRPRSRKSSGVHKHSKRHSMDSVRMVNEFKNQRDESDGLLQETVSPCPAGEEETAEQEMDEGYAAGCVGSPTVEEEYVDPPKRKKLPTISDLANSDDESQAEPVKSSQLWVEGIGDRLPRPRHGGTRARKASGLCTNSGGGDDRDNKSGRPASGGGGKKASSGKGGSGSNTKLSSTKKSQSAARSGGKHEGDVNKVAEAEDPSMPGTPLSNASAASAASGGSDTSSASASSGQALLLTHPSSSGVGVSVV